MNKIRLLIVLALVAFLFTASYPAPVVASPRPAPSLSPAAASTTELTVENNTGVNIAVELSGPQKYTFTAYPGKTVKKIESGAYKYQAKTVCGKLKKGNVKAKGAKATLTFAKCPETTVLIDTTRSKTGVTLNLSGPRSYSLRVGARSTQSFTVWKGTYNATASWCGTSRSFKLNLKKPMRIWFSCY
jgi:hypothetical protein